MCWGVMMRPGGNGCPIANRARKPRFCETAGTLFVDNIPFFSCQRGVEGYVTAAIRLIVLLGARDTVLANGTGVDGRKRGMAGPCSPKRFVGCLFQLFEQLGGSAGRGAVWQVENCAVMSGDCNQKGTTPRRSEGKNIHSSTQSSLGPLCSSGFSCWAVTRSTQWSKWCL